MRPSNGALKIYLKNFFSSPPRFFLTAYILVIIIGSLLLYSPFSTNKDISYLDAIFTSTSAISDTGLIVLDTSNDFTIFGKIIILLLIHIGGLGYMGTTTFFMLTLRKKVSFRDRLILAESLNYPGTGGLIRFLIRVFLFIIINRNDGGFTPFSYAL